MSLIAHKDTKRVEESEVMAVATPIWTDSWHPVSHYDVIHTMSQAVRSMGIDVLNREYSLSADGAKMFGTWALSLGNGKLGYELGIRNSLNKSMSLGVCAGTRVFVCDNMAFSSSFIAFRKHTSGLDLDELIVIAQRSVQGAVVEMHRMHDWQISLSEKYVPPCDFKALTFDLMKSGVMAPGHFNAFLSAHEEEKVETQFGGVLHGATTLGTVHGAVTRVMREWNLIRVASATSKLEVVLNNYLEENPVLNANWIDI